MGPSIIDCSLCVCVCVCVCVCAHAWSSTGSPPEDPSEEHDAPRGDGGAQQPGILEDRHPLRRLSGNTHARTHTHLHALSNQRDLEYNSSIRSQAHAAMHTQPCGEKLACTTGPDAPVTYWHSQNLPLHERWLAEAADSRTNTY